MWGLPPAERLSKCQELYFLVDHWNLIINRSVGPTTRLSYSQKIRKIVFNHVLQTATTEPKGKFISLPLFSHMPQYLSFPWKSKPLQDTACMQITIFRNSEPLDTQCYVLKSACSVCPNYEDLSPTRHSTLTTIKTSVSLPYISTAVAAPLSHKAHLTKRVPHWSFKS